jgi:DNA repair photolyase
MDERDEVRLPAPRGRGAVRNVRGRYDAHETVPFDDGWGTLDETPPPLVTETIPERTRTIIASNDSPDIPFTYSINPYKGCEHGCSYCFARPTHAYLNLSPGLDFESKIFTKPDAPALLRAELSRKGYAPDPIAIGANTDPYQPVERELRITRGILEVLCEYGHPFSIVTKSNLVLRDLDLIAPMAAAGRAQVFVSVTTLDRTLARRMEPRAPTPQRRVEALAALHEAGVPVGILASPMIPALNDTELERILEAGAAAGCKRAGYLVVRLPHELKQLFVEWLETHYPARAEKVLGQLRDMRGGALYDARFGHRMRGEGPFAELLERRFEIACRRLGLNRARAQGELDCSGFRVPPGPGTQGRLFG